MACKFCGAEEASDIQVLCFDEDAPDVTLSICESCKEGRGLMCLQQREHGLKFMSYDPEDQEKDGTLYVMATCLKCCAREVDALSQKKLEEHCALVCLLITESERKEYAATASDLGYGERNVDRRLIFSLMVEAHLYEISFEHLVIERSSLKVGSS